MFCSLWFAYVGLQGTVEGACYPEGYPIEPRVSERIPDTIIDGVAEQCRIELRDGSVVERTDINWEGTISAIFFPLGVFFGSAGILGLINRRLAALVTLACVAICFTMVVIFFT